MIDIVVGGQFGSEGKGKVALWLAKNSSHKCVARVGGANSGHTARGVILRHLPVSALIKGGISVIGAGSYLDLNVLMDEIERFGPNLHIDENAVLITGKESSSLRKTIGSTLSGTGHAIQTRIKRFGRSLSVKDVRELKEYCRTGMEIKEIIQNGCIIEGTQGFGLSLLHSPHYPYVTARDTTAAGFASELGISPRDVGDIYLVIRSFPIRVAGNSGPLKNECSWESLNLRPEYTSVTNNIRRVGFIDYSIIKKAIAYNNPSRIVLNHLDYIKYEERHQFIFNLEFSIGKCVDYVGLDAYSIKPNTYSLI